ncbi:MAG: TonB-dependent receptor [Deltaproteobacteria bacterium]
MKKVAQSVVVPVFFILVLVLAAASSVFAAREGDSPDDAIVMETVVVTATKTPEKRRDIPNAVIIVDKKDIQAVGAGSIGALLANVPGIDWQTYGNYGGATQEIHIRGMRGNATQVLVNGVAVNSPSWGVADVSKIPLDNIERIEVSKGSGSVLYGSGAMAGTVNVITKGPRRDKMDLKIGAGYGSQNTYRVAAENGMFVAGDFGYYLTAGRTETDGFRDNGYLRQNDVSLKLVLDKRDITQISLYGDYVDRTYGMPGVRPPPGTQDYSLGGEKFYNSESATLLDRGGDKDGHIVLEAKGVPSEWLGYNLKGHYTHMDNYIFARWPFFGMASGLESWVTNQVIGADGHVNIYPFAGAKLLVGGEYKNFDWTYEGFTLDGGGHQTVQTTKDANIYTKGFFTEAEYRPSPYGKVLAGFRHEIHSAFGSENLPVAGVVINPFKTTALKFNHGKHFLAPTPNDLYWPADLYNRGNPDLKPEIGWHTDVTLEQSLFKDKIFATLSYFHWNVEDKIQWEPDSQGVWSPINLAGYQADGIEAGIKVGPFYDLSLALGYTYTHAEEENREYSRQDYTTPDFRYSLVKRRATMTPAHRFRGDLMYKSNFGLTVTATMRYVGDQLVYNTETTVYPETQTVLYTLGSYWTADLKIEQRLYKHWVLSLAGHNLFDGKYDTHLQSFTDQTTFVSTMSAYPGAGRSVFGSVSYEF